MQNTDIDWAESSWNPVTGCLHGCKYCYARNQTTRFGGFNAEYGTAFTQAQTEQGTVYTLADPLYKKDKDYFIGDEFHEGKVRKAPYPFGFMPTFHRYRLDEPLRRKKPSTIFVGSMCDLFGSWVPNEWITEVFRSCAKAPWHRYLFLTKNPGRIYWDTEEGKESTWIEAFDGLTEAECEKLSERMWFGATFTGAENKYKWLETWRNANLDFVSIEPLHDYVDEELFFNGDDWNSKDARWKWVIIGAETGNRKDRVIPRREWVEDIVANCRTCGTPVFMKQSISKLMGDDFVQEYPWEVI